jgi:hypothetical protein
MDEESGGQGTMLHIQAQCRSWAIGDDGCELLRTVNDPVARLLVMVIAPRTLPRRDESLKLDYRRELARHVGMYCGI